MTTFLVTAASGDIGEAVGRLLQDRYPDDTVLGAEAGDPWPGRVVFGEVLAVPLAGDDAYVPAVRAIVAERGVDLVVPCAEPEVERLARTDLPVLGVAAALVDRFSDKLETARWLRARAIPAPPTAPVTEVGVGDLPIVVKPRRGSGSRGIRIVRTAAELAAVPPDAALVAQALLEGDDSEFTCTVLRLAGEVRTLQLRRRLLGGLTAAAVVEADAAIDALLHQVAAATDLEGALNVQLRVTTDGPSVFEVNPRVSSTVLMRHRLGFEDLAWQVEHALGRCVPPAVSPSPGTRVFRMSREVVVPPC